MLKNWDFWDSWSINVVFNRCPRHVDNDFLTLWDSQSINELFNRCPHTMDNDFLTLWGLLEHTKKEEKNVVFQILHGFAPCYIVNSFSKLNTSKLI